MVTQSEARKLIGLAVLSDNRTPDDLNILVQDVSGSTQNANTVLPVVLITFTNSVDPAYRNTTHVDYKTDGAGNRVAKVYEREWNATAEIETWVADKSTLDPDALGETVGDVLYGYDSRSSNDTFRDQNNDPVPKLWNFKVTGGRRVDDLTTTPVVRRWRYTAEVYGAHRYVGATGDPVTEVSIPDNLTASPDLTT